MDRNIKYKQVSRIQLYGDDDINTSTNSQYIIYPSSLPSITVNNGGTNYSAATTQITLSGGGGSGAVVATPTVSGGAITAITLTSSGVGYISQPNVIITSGINSTSNLVGGSGYTNGIFPLIILLELLLLAVVFYISQYYKYFCADHFIFQQYYWNLSGSGASVTAVIGTGASASTGGIYTDSKRMRFPLNNALNDLKLSVNARCVVEMCNIPSITNMAGKYVIVRLVTSTHDKACDTKKFLNGNPILLSMAKQTTVNSTNVLYNAYEFFYNINVPSTLFSNGYIDLELEVPSATANIDFITSKPLST